MSKMFLKMSLSLGLLAAAAVAWSAGAAGPATKVLSGHVPAGLAKLKPFGRPDAASQLRLAIGLPVRNQEELKTLLEQIYDPSSPNYRHYLTPEEYTARFGPTEQDYQNVVNFAKAHGLTVTATHGNRMLVDVIGKVADLEGAFNVTIRKYHHPSEARDFYAPDADPTVESGLPILHVQGLDNYTRPRPMAHLAAKPGANPAIGSGPSGLYIGKDFRNAYVPGTTLNGTGQIVGLLQFDGYYESDIRTYEAIAGMTNVPLQNVLLDGFDGTPGQNNSEVCLDIECSIAMAPALAKVVVFEAGPFGNPDDILNAMAASNQIKQLSSSWGFGLTPTSEQIFQQMALQGQTYLNCSGDGDAWVGPITFGSVQSAYVTVVGGTTLTMNDTATAYVSETAWNQGFVGSYNWNPDGYVGSSGGISTTVPIPNWQKGLDMTTNHGSTTMRNVPDVALTADNIFAVYDGGVQSGMAGTSAATPLWAGYMALVNQQAAASGKPAVGFLAPTVFAIAKTTNYLNCFHDTVAGDTTWSQSPTNFFAVPGYDLCTGLGTPNGTNMINALIGLSSGGGGGGGGGGFIPVSAPTSWTTNLSALNGSNPNGPWYLFVQDTAALNVGTIAGGWSVTLTTGNAVGSAADNAIYAAPVSSPAVIPGSHWTLTLAVTNYGPSLSSNVYVADALPIGLTLLSNTPTMGSVTQSGPQLTWNVGTLPMNAGATMTLYFQAAVAGAYTNSATVNALTSDPNPDDDTVYSGLMVMVPAPPQMVPHILPAGGGFQLTVNGDAFPTAVQASTNLYNWVPVYTNIPPFVYTNANITSPPQQFYRAVVIP